MTTAMQDNNKSTIPIFDLYLAAFLTFHGFAPELSAHGNRVVFLFESGSEFNRLSRLYSDNEKIPVISFVQELRKLRSKMLSFKEDFEYASGGGR